MLSTGDYVSSREKDGYHLFTVVDIDKDGVVLQENPMADCKKSLRDGTILTDSGETFLVKIIWKWIGDKHKRIVLR